MATNVEQLQKFIVAERIYQSALVGLEDAIKEAALHLGWGNNAGLDLRDGIRETLAMKVAMEVIK